MHEHNLHQFDDRVLLGSAVTKKSGLFGKARPGRRAMDHLPAREGPLVCKAVVHALRGEQVHQSRQIPCIDGCIVPADIDMDADVGAGLSPGFNYCAGGL